MNTTKQAPYDYNRATLPNAETHGDPQNAVNRSGDKETVQTLALMFFDASARKRSHAQAKEAGYDTNPHDGFATPIEARWYMGRSNSASTVYCSVWIRTRDGQRYISGNGSAGGYGYDKFSAAFDDALRSAGVKLEKSCGGCGDGPMRKAMLAVAKACGYRPSQQPYTFA